MSAAAESLLLLRDSTSAHSGVQKGDEFFQTFFLQDDKNIFIVIYSLNATWKYFLHDIFVLCTLSANDSLGPI